jgi:hypothetical protein
MRRAALSPNALELPSQPSSSVHLEIVRGRRQRVVRSGIFFTVIDRHRRSAYMQFDGKLILADECTCRVEFTDPFFPAEYCSGVSFIVVRNAGCPIHEHSELAVRKLRNEEAS